MYVYDLKQRTQSQQQSNEHFTAIFLFCTFSSSSVCKNKIGNRDYEQRIYFSNTFFKKPIMNIFTQTQPSQSQGTLNKKKLFEIA